MLENNAADQLAARAYQGGPLGQVPGVERRLGPSAANGTGARRCRSGSARRRATDGGGGRATTNCWPSQEWRGPRCGTRRRKRIPNCPTTCGFTNRTSTRSTYDCAKCEGARMRRVTEVIDCWYDSGAMPFAQWGYRGQQSGEAKERFQSQFPADFISEALDQTRGWFYSQLAISTMLWGGERAE